MDFVPLSSLNATSGSVPVQVRVCRLWDARNPHSRVLISMDLIVADTEGTSMWVQIKSELVKRFRHPLNVGCVYSFRNFNVVINSGKYRPVTTSARIVFSIITAVKRITVPVPAIPQHIFQFVSCAQVVDRSGDPTYLSDIIGHLVSIGEVEAVSGGRVKRDLEVVTESFGKVRVTLWADMAHTFVADHMHESTDGPILIILTALKITQFSGAFSSPTWNMSRHYASAGTLARSPPRLLFLAAHPVLLELLPRRWLKIGCPSRQSWRAAGLTRSRAIRSLFVVA